MARGKVKSPLGKVEIDNRIAVLTGYKRKEVSEITTALIKELRNAVLGERGIVLHSFGTFTVTIYKQETSNNLKSIKHGVVNTRHLKVFFKKAASLREAFRRKRMANANDDVEMEKYGVNEGMDQEALEKKAAGGCPECGAPAKRHGNILVCPTHGTQPFE